MTESPSTGDVLITSDTHGHFISVVPHPHRLSFTSFPAALQLALRWAGANNAEVWHAIDGKVSRIDAPAPDLQADRFGS